MSTVCFSPCDQEKEREGAAIEDVFEYTAMTRQWESVSIYIGLQTYS